MRILTSILIVVCLSFSCSKAGKHEDVKTTVTSQKVQVSSPLTNVQVLKPKYTGIRAYWAKGKRGIVMRSCPTNSRGEYQDYTNYLDKVFRYDKVSETYKEVVK